MLWHKIRRKRRGALAAFVGCSPESGGEGLGRAALFEALRDAEQNARDAALADDRYDKAFYRQGLANVAIARASGGGGDAPLPQELLLRLQEAAKVPFHNTQRPARLHSLSVCVARARATKTRRRKNTRPPPG